MLSLRLATFNLHELIEFQYPSLTARPSFATLMENRLARMVHTLL